MKSCAYCGKQNQDDAALCAECGTELPTQPQSAGGTEIRWWETYADPARLFRALVVISTISYVVWSFELLLGSRFIDPGALDACSWQGYGAVLPIPDRLGWLFLLLNLAAAVGLWMFSKSARLLFAMLTAFSVVAILLGGVQVQTAFGSVLGVLTTMADGAILVMAFTTPLRERFE